MKATTDNNEKIRLSNNMFYRHRRELEAKFYWMTTNRHLTKEQIRELRKTLKSFTNELKRITT